jgi:hypothetical protein
MFTAEIGHTLTGICKNVAPTSQKNEVCLQFKDKSIKNVDEFVPGNSENCTK